MARIRTIKPEIASDVKLASVSIQARYTFVLLISQADDEGLIAGSHRQLLGSLYPHDETVSTGDLLSWVEELVTVGLLRWRATLEGAPVLELANWSKHQRIDNKGRSQLAAALSPLAESRGEPPRTAETRGLEGDLGPRTLDRGSGTVPTAPPDQVREFIGAHDFGPFAESVEGLIRAARNPVAVLGTLRMHLGGEMGYEPATPRELGMAAQQYSANGEAFNPAFFAGFIRTAKKGVTRLDNRRRNANEDKRLASEDDAKRRADAEAREADELLAAFARDRPDQYAEFQRQAEAAMPPKITHGREIMIRAHILRSIRGQAA